MANQGSPGKWPLKRREEDKLDKTLDIIVWQLEVHMVVCIPPTWAKPNQHHDIWRFTLIHTIRITPKFIISSLFQKLSSRNYIKKATPTTIRIRIKVMIWVTHTNDPVSPVLLCWYSGDLTRVTCTSSGCHQWYLCQVICCSLLQQSMAQVWHSSTVPAYQSWPGILDAKWVCLCSVSRYLSQEQSTQKASSQSVQNCLRYPTIRAKSRKIHTEPGKLKPITSSSSHRPLTKKLFIPESVQDFLSYY